MSLKAVSWRLATDPNTNAARICLDNGFSASRRGSANPTVFCAMPQSSAKMGEAGLA